MGPHHLYTRLTISCFADERVRMINLEDGSILSGEEAPKRKDQEKWMEQNPGFVTESSAMDPVDVEEEINMALEKGRRKRRPRLDPYKLDLDSLTGEENVSVVHRETGKKVNLLFSDYTGQNFQKF